MQLEFIKCDPSGNPTVLIDNRSASISPDQYAMAARAIMQEPYLLGEQVGFIEKPLLPGSDGRLVMMGGELCINALRCFVLLMSVDQKSYLIESSGTEKRISASRRKVGEEIEVTLDLEVTTDYLFVNGRHSVVFLPGITHHVIQTDKELGREALSREMDILVNRPEWGGRNLATGIINAVGTQSQFTIEALIHVTETDTLVYESSCGSGSIAAHIAMRGGSGGGESAVRQPSGADLIVRSRDRGFSIMGMSRVTSRGSVFLSETDLARWRPDTLRQLSLVP